MSKRQCSLLGHDFTRWEWVMAPDPTGRHDGWWERHCQQCSTRQARIAR